MTYCNLQELTERYGERTLVQLTDRADVPTGIVDTTVITRAITDTASLIDGYLKGRYALPLAEVPPLLTDIALQIAIYKLHAHVAEEKIRKDYDDATKTLRDIGAGKVRLDVAGAEPTGSGSADVRTNEPARPLSADKMKGFI